MEYNNYISYKDDEITKFEQDKYYDYKGIITLFVVDIAIFYGLFYLINHTNYFSLTESIIIAIISYIILFWLLFYLNPIVALILYAPFGIMFPNNVI